MRFALFAAVSAFATIASLAYAESAHAEPTSWLAVGGGYGLQRNGFADTNSGAGVMSLSIGVGTTSRNALGVGGIARITTYFSLGTDVGLGVRFATGSFARGDWGLALDLGVAGRWWKEEAYGHFPAQAVLTGGLPWGFNVAVGADLFDVSGDKPHATGGFAVLELDLLRLTVMRSGKTTSFWPNPSPVDAQH